MGISFFPSPRDGETVYSLASRFHAHLGDPSPAWTSRTLFGWNHAHAYPEVPICLKHLALLTDGAVSADETTIRSRSGLAPHWALLDFDRRRRVLETCASGDPAAAKSRLGLGRHTSASKLLKFCPQCATGDLWDSWWRAADQQPGVWHCQVHKRLLVYVLIADPRSFGWKLPHQVRPSAIAPRLLVEEDLKLLRVGQVISWLAGAPRVDTQLLALMLRRRLHKAGLVRSEIRVLASEQSHLAALSVQHYAAVNVPDVLKANSRGWLTTLLSEARHFDPLTWALGLAWVGGVERSMLNAEYDEARSRKPQRDLFRLQRAMRRRAPDNIYVALKEGRSKADAIRLACCSASELDSWLRRDAQLRTHWESSKWSKTRSQCLRTVRSFVRDHPEALRVNVLRSCTAAYLWLSINDRDSLEESLPLPIKHLARQLSLDF